MGVLLCLCSAEEASTSMSIRARAEGRKTGPREGFCSIPTRQRAESECGHGCGSVWTVTLNEPPLTLLL